MNKLVSMKNVLIIALISLVAGIIIGSIITNTYRNKADFIKTKTEYHDVKMKIFAKEDLTAKKGEIVFLGDSITDFYNMKTFYPEFVCYNRGISMDTTEDVLNRLDEVYKLEPSVIVLLIGVNDFMNEHQSVKHVEKNYKKILKEINKNLPECQVICQSLYPGADGKIVKLSKWQDEIIEVNEFIFKESAKFGYVYANVYPTLTGKDEGINRKLFKDGVHPNDKGYLAITEFLKPVVKQEYQKQKMK